MRAPDLQEHESHPSDHLRNHLLENKPTEQGSAQCSHSEAVVEAVVILLLKPCAFTAVGVLQPLQQVLPGWPRAASSKGLHTLRSLGIKAPQRRK